MQPSSDRQSLAVPERSAKGERTARTPRSAAHRFFAKAVSFINAAAAFLFCGLSFGWILGLTVTPVIQGVVQVLLGVLITALALVVGIRPNFTLNKDGLTQITAKKARAWRGNPWPVAFLTLGIAVGSTAGATARINFWFWPDAKKMLADGLIREPGLNAGRLDPLVLEQLKLLPASELQSKLSVTHDPVLRRIYEQHPGNARELWDHIQGLTGLPAVLP